MAGSGGKQVVLLGAGHAHLYTLKRAAEVVRHGHRLVLVAPDAFWYSGLATGMLGGIYPPELDQVDVGSLVTAGGGRFIRDRVVRIDPSACTVYLERGEPLTYDALSLNLGSDVPAQAIPGAELAYTVKPIANLWRLRQDVEARLHVASDAAPVRVAIIGGGATGCEIAANVERLARVRGGAVTITLLARGDRVLEQIPAPAAQRVASALERRGIVIRRRAAVHRVEPGVAVTADGRREAFDVLVDASGLRPSRLLAATGLPTNGDGALLVDDHLRSIADPRVHGAGDCVALRGADLARVGVFAVRQSPILFHNLLASLDGTAPRRFVPQRRYLLILNLGDGTGLATRGRWYWQGRLAFRLKDYIDRRFLAEYQSATASRSTASPQ